jgi:hypothetical protein
VVKTHYSVLGIAQQATPEEVKKTYRQLALLYHPDRAPDNPLAYARFLEIQDAYSVLSNERLRRQYDEELFFSSLSGRRPGHQPTSQWLLEQSSNLRRHMTLVDTDRMNHAALQQYVANLLTPSNLAVLETEASIEVRHTFVGHVLDALRALHYQRLLALAPVLTAVADFDPALQKTLETLIARRRIAYLTDKLAPWAVVMVALALCAMMYLFAL